jgi:ketosteroid isomerase-like protein
VNRTEVAQRVEDLLRAWNARDLDGFLAFLTPDVYWHDLGMPAPPAVGRDAVRRFCESLLRAFPDFAYEVRGPLCIADDGSGCVVPWTISASHRGPFDPPGFAPTGRSVHFNGLDYLEFRGDRVARIETRFDPVEPIEQLLGLRVRPPSGSWRERCLVWAQRAGAAWLRSRGDAA